MSNLLFLTLLVLSNLHIIFVSGTDLSGYNVQPICSTGDYVDRRLADYDPIKTSTKDEIITWREPHLRRLSANEANNKSDSSMTDLDGGSSCKQPCSDDLMEFCGNDGQCHKSTCKNIYKYGNSSFTGVLSDNPPDLTCTIIDPLTTDMDLVPVAVSYSCMGYRCTDDNGVDNALRRNVIHMNQYCNAQPIDDYAFLCYDLVPHNETDIFSEFIAETNGTTTGFECDVDSQDTVPQYMYQMSYGYWSMHNNFKNCTNATAFLCELGGYIAVGGKPSSIFNETMAYSAFFSQLSYILPATIAPTSSPAPTMSPTSETPTASASRHLSSKYPKLIIFWLGLLFI